MNLMKAIKRWWNKSDIWAERYSDSYADYPGVGKVHAKDVAEFTKQHLRFIDRFDTRKVVEAALMPQDILFNVFTEDELPKKDNWKF